MRWKMNRGPVRAGMVLAWGFGLCTMGCGGSLLGLDDDGAQEVRIVLTVDDEAGAVTYVSSNAFQITPLQDRVQIRLLDSDTVTTTLPLDQTFPTGDERQFVFVVVDRDAVPGLIRLRMYLDGDLRLERSFPPEEDLRVVYLFGSNIFAEDIEIV